MSNALDDLIAAVEGGTAIQVDCWTVSDKHNAGMYCWDAYNGSLDAALALHNAVLPDWLVHSLDQDSAKRWYVTLTRYRHKSGLVHTGGEDLARAWLIAILRAMKEGKQ